MFTRLRDKNIVLAKFSSERVAKIERHPVVWTAPQSSNRKGEDNPNYQETNLISRIKNLVFLYSRFIEINLDAFHQLRMRVFVA